MLTAVLDPDGEESPGDLGFPGIALRLSLRLWVSDRAHDSFDALIPQTAVRIADIERIFEGAENFPTRMKLRSQRDCTQGLTHIANTHPYRGLLVRGDELIIAW